VTAMIATGEFARNSGYPGAWPMCGPPSSRPDTITAWHRRWADEIARRQEATLLWERLLAAPPDVSGSITYVNTDTE